MIKKITLFVLCVLMCLVGGVATLRNNQSVSFDYYFAVAEGPFVLFLFGALLLGVTAGLFVASIWIFRQYRQLRKLEHNKKLIQQELDNLRELRSSDL